MERTALACSVFSSPGACWKHGEAPLGQSCHRRLSILLGLSGWQVLGFDWTALLPTDSIPQC